MVKSDTEEDALKYSHAHSEGVLSEQKVYEKDTVKNLPSVAPPAASDILKHVIKLESLMRGDGSLSSQRVLDPATQRYYEMREITFSLSHRDDELQMFAYQGAIDKIRRIESNHVAKVVFAKISQDQLSELKIRKALVLTEIGECSLKDLITVRNESNRSWKLEEITKILHESLEGVRALHTAGIFHRNIQPSSLAISRDGHIIVSGFDDVESYSKAPDGRFLIRRGSGPHYYCPPELKGIAGGDKISPLA